MKVVRNKVQVTCCRFDQSFDCNGGMETKKLHVVLTNTFYTDKLPLQLLLGYMCRSKMLTFLQDSQIKIIM